MRSKSRLPKIFLSVIAATLVVCCAQQRTAQAVVYWVGDGGSNLWDETATAWQTTNPGTSTFSATTSYTDFTDDVVFDRDTTANKTITVRTAGVTPNDLNIDTGVKWIFQPQTVGGGKINAFLDHTATSGGATSMTFRYDSSPGFTGADIRGATIWELSAAASSGSYTF